MKKSKSKKTKVDRLGAFLAAAEKGPIRIRRRSGRAFVLMTEAAYGGLQKELESLQGRVLGMADVIAGNVTKYQLGDRKSLDRLKK